MKVVNLNLSLSLALLVIGFILIMINPYVNLRWGQYGIVPVFWLSSVLTIVSLWNACRHVDKWVGAKHGLKNIYIYIYIKYWKRLNSICLFKPVSYFSVIQPFWFG